MSGLNEGLTIEVVVQKRFIDVQIKDAVTPSTCYDHAIKPMEGNKKK